MRLFEIAVSEQLRGSINPIEGIGKASRLSIATPGQISGWRRRPENILIEMIDRQRSKSSHDNNENPVKKSSRRRKRGPRSLEAIERRKIRNLKAD